MGEALNMLAFPYKEHKNKDILRQECCRSLDAWIHLYQGTTDSQDIKFKLINEGKLSTANYYDFIPISEDLKNHMLDNLTNDVLHRANSL